MKAGNYCNHRNRKTEINLTALKTDSENYQDYFQIGESINQ